MLSLALEEGQLTPAAQDALRLELIRRGLSTDEVREKRMEREFDKKVRVKKKISASLNGNARIRYGKANRILLAKTNRERFTTTVFFGVAHFPLIPLASYRVERLRSFWRGRIIVLEKLPLDWEQVLRVWVAASGILLLFMWAFKLWLMLLKR